MKINFNNFFIESDSAIFGRSRVGRIRVEAALSMRRQRRLADNGRP
jgi:hypothetical protein